MPVPSVVVRRCNGNVARWMLLLAPVFSDLNDPALWVLLLVWCFRYCFAWLRYLLPSFGLEEARLSQDPASRETQVSFSVFTGGERWTIVVLVP